MEWILIALIYAGPLASGDSIALQSIPGWKTEANCREAGKAMEVLVMGSAKVMRFVCVKRT